MPTYSALKFDKGMTPKVFTKDSATRIEHFDTITEVLRPFRTLVAGTLAGSAPDLITASLKKFTFLNDTVYGLGVDNSTPANGAVYAFDGPNGYWTGKIPFNTGATTRNVFIAHAGNFYGVNLSGGSAKDAIWKLTTGGTYTAAFYDTTVNHTNYADPIVHSKDGIAYFPMDNKIYKITSDGATGSLALTLPNANFQITSICEQGVYINIAGVDTKTGKSSSLLWDRDTSVVDMTESYDLSNDIVVLNGNILGTTFFVQLRVNSSATVWQEQPVLVIKWLNGPTPTTLYEFPVSSCAISSNSIGAKHVTTDRIYFSAVVKFIGESTARNIVFCLDQNGRLTIAQNASIDTEVSTVGTGLIRVGEGFWIAKSTIGAWNTTSTYTTISSYETNDIRSEDLFMNLDFQTAVITCEPLPASGQIVLKARKNEETAWTTVGTYSQTNRSKFKVNVTKAKNALAGLDRAKQVRLRLESTVGATITGFQAIFKEVTDLDV